MAQEPGDRSTLAAYRDETDPPVIREPLLAGLRSLWEEKRAGRPLPARADFDIADLRPFFGNLFLLDVLQDGRDFRFRLLGTNLTERFGRDSTGKIFSETYPVGQSPQADWLLGVYRRTVEQRLPVWSAAPMVQVGRAFSIATALHLPLSADGVYVNMILGATVFSPG